MEIKGSDNSETRAKDMKEESIEPGRRHRNPQSYTK